jgi:hypothetical protein
MKREAKQSGRAGGRIASSLGLFHRMAKSPFWHLSDRPAQDARAFHFLMEAYPALTK